MNKKQYETLLKQVACPAIFAAIVAACGGSDGKDGQDGKDGTDGVAGTTGAVGEPGTDALPPIYAQPDMQHHDNRDNEYRENGKGQQ